MNDRDQDQRTGGRSLSVLAWADTLDGLEMVALDAARDLFGPAARLDVVRDYEVHATRCPKETGHEKYNASITVREIAP